MNSDTSKREYIKTILIILGVFVVFLFISYCFVGEDGSDVEMPSVPESSTAESVPSDELFSSEISEEPSRNESEYVSEDQSEEISESESEETSDIVSEVSEAVSEPPKESSVPDEEPSEPEVPSEEPSETPSEEPSQESSVLEINSKYCMVYNVTDGKVVFQKNADNKCYPASVTKMLTAVVALENVSAETVFTVGNEIYLVGSNSSVAHLKRGQKIKLKDLIYALMLPSGNDAAYTIAVNTARIIYGSSLTIDQAVKKFCELMTATAHRLGAKDSNFVCPDGYHDSDTYTTAHDMMLITKRASEFSHIRKAASTYLYTCTFASGETYTFKNTNKFINPNSEYYDSRVTGFKTGCTDDAAHCIAVTATVNNKKYIITLFFAPTANRRERDIQTILNYIAN